MQNKYVALVALGALVLGSTNTMAAGKSGVAAVVNGKEIKVSELKQAYNANAEIKSKVSFDEFYEKALDVYVNGKLLYQVAVEDGIINSPEYKTQLGMAKEELARKVYLEKAVDKKVSDSKLKELYADYKKSFKAEKEVKAKHILVSSESKAKEAIEKLKKGGDFDKLAKEYSKEPAELGYFTKAVMVPEFSEAAFSMKEGEYTKKPVKTQFGYHVIIVEDIRNAKVLPYETVKPQLKAMMTQGAMGEIFEDINKSAKITKYDLKGNVQK